VIVVVATHNLAIGVFVGVLLASLFFANKIGRFMVVRQDSSADEEKAPSRTYKVVGQVFFASADSFIASFDFKEVLESVTIDLTQAHFWDITAVAALDKVVIRFRREGTAVQLLGMNEATQTVVGKFSEFDKPDEGDKIGAH